MFSQTKKILLFSLIVLSCFSCSHKYNYLYAPNEGSSLTLRKEKDLKASAAYGTPASQGTGLGLLAGYSPIRHLGIQSGFLTINARENKDVYTKHNLVNLAVGAYFFKPFKKASEADLEASKRSGILFDLYSGIAYGTNKNGFKINNYSSLNFNKLFLQGGFLVKEGGLEISIHVKAGRLKFTNGEAFVFHDHNRVEEYEYLNRNNPYLFLEGTWKMQLGKGPVRNYFAFSVFLNNKSFLLPFYEQNWATGITVDIGELHKRKSYHKQQKF